MRMRIALGVLWTLLTIGYVFTETWVLAGLTGLLAITNFVLAVLAWRERRAIQAAAVLTLLARPKRGRFE